MTGTNALTALKLVQTPLKNPRRHEPAGAENKKAPPAEAERGQVDAMTSGEDTLALHRARVPRERGKLRKHYYVETPYYIRGDTNSHATRYSLVGR